MSGGPPLGELIVKNRSAISVHRPSNDIGQELAAHPDSINNNPTSEPFDVRARNQPMPAQSTFCPQLDDRPVQRRNDASQPRYYRPELDVLRFTAFFMVFLSHVVPGHETFFAEAGIPSSLAGFIIFAAAGGAFGVESADEHRLDPP